MIFLQGAPGKDGDVGAPGPSGPAVCCLQILFCCCCIGFCFHNK